MIRLIKTTTRALVDKLIQQQTLWLVCLHLVCICCLIHWFFQWIIFVKYALILVPRGGLGWYDHRLCNHTLVSLKCSQFISVLRKWQTTNRHWVSFILSISWIKLISQLVICWVEVIIVWGVLLWIWVVFLCLRCVLFWQVGVLHLFIYQVKLLFYGQNLSSSFLFRSKRFIV